MLATIAIIIISVFMLLFAINHFFGNKDLYEKTSHIPGPLAFPLIGSAYLFIGDISSTNILQKISKVVYTYASPCRFIVGINVSVLIHEPEHIKTVLLSSKTTEKHAIYDFGKVWIGNGLVTAPRDVWRVHRKLIQPAFVPKILHSFVAIFQKTSILLVNEWAGQVDGPEFEVYSYLIFTSFRNICESSLGMPVTTKTKPIEQYIEACERVFEMAALRPTKPWLHSDTIFNMTPKSKIFYEAVKYLKSFTMNVIEERRNYLKSESFGNEDEIEKKTFLDLMLEMADNGHFTDEEVREHSDTMITAGYDTVARVNCFTLLMLASHPDIQAERTRPSDPGHTRSIKPRGQIFRRAPGSTLNTKSPTFTGVTSVFHVDRGNSVGRYPLTHREQNISDKL
ncbi:cytochrome P450 4C1-like [Belonocnema kinseyi]|uniref:cytochrome P450 4C1-like n=1 Tax=Belonocnema kinseyi TaxID=2817044 RepID=UPI00143CD279|nr:cytochrome P450 4C1-like [Belonocnema kinseyi]